MKLKFNGKYGVNFLSRQLKNDVVEGDTIFIYSDGNRHCIVTAVKFDHHSRPKLCVATRDASGKHETAYWDRIHRAIGYGMERIADKEADMSIRKKMEEVTSPEMEQHRALSVASAAFINELEQEEEL